MKRDVEAIIAELRAASIDDGHGRRFVRRADAVRILGVTSSGATVWQNTGVVQVVRIRHKPTLRSVDQVGLQRGAMIRGMVALWPLDQAIACASRPPRPQWTEAEDDLLTEWLSVESFEQIAARLGRSLHAVRARAGKLGITLQENNGYLTSRAFAQLVVRTTCAVEIWCRRGMPHTRTGGYHRFYQIDLHKAVAWLQRQPATWAKLGPLVQDRLLRATQRREAA